MGEPGYLEKPDEAAMERADKHIQRVGTIVFFVFLLVAVGGYFGLPLLFEFPTELAERLGFAAVASVFLWVWVLIGVGMVSTGRRFSPEDIGGSAAGPPSEKIAIPAAFLQNTLEQAALLSAALLGLSVLVSGDYLAVIPAAVVFFGVGRVLFYRGYARGVEGRALGMNLTMMPAIVGYLWIFGLVPWRFFVG